MDPGNMYNFFVCISEYLVVKMVDVIIFEIEKRTLFEITNC